MTDLICAWWCQSLNVGDRLTPYLIEKITGKPPVYVEPNFNSRHYVFSGSVLNHCGIGSIVWGAGLGSIVDGVNPHIAITAVRGPISRARALSCGAKAPAIYGDPGLVMPKVYNKSIQVTRDIGVVPHYVDSYRAYSWWDTNQVISPLNAPEFFVDELRSCRKIISSSLHGIVLAHAYGIPAAWVKMSDSVGGDGTKFRDHFMSVGLDVDQPIDLRNGKAEIPDRAFTVPNADKLAEVREKLWDARPLR